MMCTHSFLERACHNIALTASDKLCRLSGKRWTCLTVVAEADVKSSKAGEDHWDDGRDQLKMVFVVTETH